MKVLPPFLAVMACVSALNLKQPLPFQRHLQEKDIVQLTAATPALSTLLTAVTAADLAGTLSGAGPLTVFAPTNDAFDKVDKQVLAALLQPANKAKLVELLQYHVVSGGVKSSALRDGQKVDTLLGGATVSVGVSASGAVSVNSAAVVTADVEASNGVVHVIDAVLIPPSLGSFIVGVASAVPSCRCAGVGTRFGGSHCTDGRFNGGRFCYVEPGACSDGAMLTARYGVAAAGMEWSYKVCEDAASASMNVGPVVGVVPTVGSDGHVDLADWASGGWEVSGDSTGSMRGRSSGTLATDSASVPTSATFKGNVDLHKGGFIGIEKSFASASEIDLSSFAGVWVEYDTLPGA
jgi:uncharacterized surface protein with fasciclin (FAS1) repeats